jgi:TRAP-type C4-dicarboxylate transport system permease small subunit
MATSPHLNDTNTYSMISLQTKIAWIAGKLNRIAAMCLIAMMALSCLDIVLRLLQRPLPGTYEIVGFLSALMLSFAMAQTTIERGHVMVEIFMNKMPRFIQKITFIVTRVTTAVIFILLAYETIKFGKYYQKSGELSLTLQLEFYPILYAMGCAFAVSAIVPIIDAVLVASGKRKTRFSWDD